MSSQTAGNLNKVVGEFCYGILEDTLDDIFEFSRNVHLVLYTLLFAWWPYFYHDETCFTYFVFRFLFVSHL